jgi:tripartite-type tricarboxylate transporter receptor subunit TctC
MFITRYKATALLAVVFFSMSEVTLAQGVEKAYPSRAIRLVVPYAAGGGTDILARQIAKQVSENLGQAIIVDNKPGAGTVLGASEVAKAAPDGYTLLWGDSGTFAVNPHVYKNIPYDPQLSFAPVTLTVKGALVLVAANKLGVKTVSELITYANSNPNKLTYGSPGNGTPHHLTMEAFKLRAGGISIQHAPYKGEAPALQDLLGGNIDVMFAGARVVKQHIESGKITVIAVSGAKRNMTMPNIPTVEEAGLKGYVSEYWHGVVAPIKTPPEIIAKINAGFIKALRSPQMVAWIENAGSGSEWTGSTPAEMQVHIKRELKSSGELVKAIGLTMD